MDKTEFSQDNQRVNPADLANRLLDLFPGLKRAHGRFIPDGDAPDGTKAKGDAKTVHEPYTAELWEKHLSGEQGLGVVPIRDDDTCWWGCIDVDVYDLDLNELEAKVRDLPLVVCRSKSGGAHVFVFTTEPVPAGLMRQKLAEIVTALGLPDKTEVFPKQTRLDNGAVGNWLNMPYFGGRFSTRYCVKDGDSIKAEEFVEYAESKRLSAQQVSALDLSGLEPLRVNDAKPASGKAVNGVYAAAGRNNGLYVEARRLHEQQRYTHPEIKAMIVALDAERHADHPEGPLGEDELQQTVFKSLVKLEEHGPAAAGDPMWMLSSVLSLSQLATIEVPEQEWLIERIIACESINMIYGPRGSGKTWLAYAIAKAGVTGDDLFGHYATLRPFRTLIVDGEMTVSLLQKRMGLLFGCQGLPETIEILSSMYTLQCHDRSIEIDSDEGREQINLLLDALERAGRRPDVVIFDNLSSLVWQTPENDNTEQSNILRWLIGLRGRGYAVIIIHHSSKTGDQRGASRREDLLNTSIKIEPIAWKPGDPPLTGARFKLTFAKHRDVPPDPYALGVSLERAEDPDLVDFYPETPPGPPRRVEILRTIYARRPETQKELAGIEGVSEKTVSQHCSELRKRKLLTSNGLDVTADGVRMLKEHFDLEEPQPATVESGDLFGGQSGG